MKWLKKYFAYFTSKITGDNMAYKFFYIGDFKSNNGPGIANRNLKRGIKQAMMEHPGSYKVYFSRRSCLPSRIWEMIQYIAWSDFVCICNYTRLHLFAAWLAKKMKKKCIYRLHGYATYESQVNHPNMDKKSWNRVHRQESFLFKHVDKIICVSKISKDYMVGQEPLYANKFHYCYNAVNYQKIENLIGVKKNSGKDKCLILSVGGGMPGKNNLTVAKGIQILQRKHPEISFEYTIVGAAYTQKDALRHYSFVKYYDHLPHKQLLEKMKESDIYIQDSTFDTFNLSAIEALMCGCSLLLSKNIGALGIFENISSRNIIYSVKDAEEISEKIWNIYICPNYSELKQAIKYQLIDTQMVAERFIELCIQ